MRKNRFQKQELRRLVARANRDLGRPVFSYESPRPLALDTARALREALPHWTDQDRRRLLGYYSHRVRYFLGLAAEGSWRVDLTGTPVEPVSEVARDRAQCAISRFIERQQAQGRPIPAAVTARPEPMGGPAQRSPELPDLSGLTAAQLDTLIAEAEELLAELDQRISEAEKLLARTRLDPSVLLRR